MRLTRIRRDRKNGYKKPRNCGIFASHACEKIKFGSVTGITWRRPFTKKETKSNCAFKVRRGRS